MSNLPKFSRTQCQTFQFAVQSSKKVFDTGRHDHSQQHHHHRSRSSTTTSTTNTLYKKKSMDLETGTLPLPTLPLFSMFTLAHQVSTCNSSCHIHIRTLNSLALYVGKSKSRTDDETTRDETAVVNNEHIWPAFLFLELKFSLALR